MVIDIGSLTKALIGIALLVLSFAGGMYLGKGKVEVVTKEGKTKTIIRTVTVTKIIRPDGTIETTTKTEDKAVDKETTSVSKKSKESSWGVGGGARASFKDLRAPDYYGTVSRRVLGPVWVEMQGTKKDASLGVRVEF